MSDKLDLVRQSLSEAAGRSSAKEQDVPDNILTAEGLRKKYNNHEHPELTQELWGKAVWAKTTLDGYWEWLYQQTRS